MALAANTQSCRIVLWKNFKKIFKNTFKNTFKNAFKNTFENYSTLLETRIIIHILQKMRWKTTASRSCVRIGLNGSVIAFSRKQAVTFGCEVAH